MKRCGIIEATRKSVQQLAEETSIMTPETAWAEAMKFENRANPYPFFDELRKTPVAMVGNGIFAVSGYREIVALAHDPRVSSDLRNNSLAIRMKSDAKPMPDALAAYGEDPMFIASD